MSNKILETWTPTVVAEDGRAVYATFMVEGSRCACCKRVMIAGRGTAKQSAPTYFRANLQAQVERAGWCFLSGSRNGEDPICVDCEHAGSGRFSCSLCGEQREGQPVEWWDGDALCQHCYETVPAKIWEEKRLALEDKHQYDHC
jgi:hypothetical protein